MSGQATNRKEQNNPVNDTELAWKIAANPNNYSKTIRKLLVSTRGQKCYNSLDALLNDVSQFIADSLDRYAVTRDARADFIIRV